MCRTWVQLLYTVITHIIVSSLARSLQRRIQCLQFQQFKIKSAILKKATAKSSIFSHNSNKTLCEPLWRTNPSYSGRVSWFSISDNIWDLCTHLYWHMFSSLTCNVYIIAVKHSTSLLLMIDRASVGNRLLLIITLSSTPHWSDQMFVLKRDSAVVCDETLENRSKVLTWPITIEDIRHIPSSTPSGQSQCSKHWSLCWHKLHPLNRSTQEPIRSRYQMGGGFKGESLCFWQLCRPFNCIMPLSQ